MALLVLGWCSLLAGLFGIAHRMMVCAPLVVHVGFGERVVFSQLGWSYVSARIERKRTHWPLPIWRSSHKFDGAVRMPHCSRLSMSDLHEMSDSDLHEFAKAMVNNAAKGGVNGL